MPQFENDWKPILITDSTLNNSNKTFTVPAGKIYKIQSVFVTLISDGNAGNRQMTLQINDAGSNVIATIKAGIVQAASLTRNYQFAPYVANLTAFIDTTFLSTPIPELVLPQNFIIRVYDSTAVAAATDDMTVQLLLRVYG